MSNHVPSNDGFFGAWIQQRRKSLDLTQDELARQVGCSLSAIRKIESAERLLLELMPRSTSQRIEAARVQQADNFEVIVNRVLGAHG